LNQPIGSYKQTDKAYIQTHTHKRTEYYYRYRHKLWRNFMIPSVQASHDLGVCELIVSQSLFRHKNTGTESLTKLN